VGTGISCNTLLHGVEEWFDVPQRLTAEKEALRVETPDGRILEVPSRRHQGHYSDNYAKLEGLFARRGILKTFGFGSAQCHLVESAPMTEITLNLLKKDPVLFSHPNVPEAD
jgi:aminoglycoside 3-N-acetyltransferase